MVKLSRDQAKQVERGVNTLSALPIAGGSVSLFVLLIFAVGKINAKAKNMHELFPNDKDKEKHYIRTRNVMSTTGLLLIPSFTGLISHALAADEADTMTMTSLSKNIAFFLAGGSLVSMIVIITMMDIKRRRLQAEVDDRVAVPVVPKIKSRL